MQHQSGQAAPRAGFCLQSGQGALADLRRAGNHCGGAGLDRVRHLHLTPLVHWIRHHFEMVSLALLGTVVVAVWALAELTEEVLEGDTSTLDRTILLALRTTGDLGNPVGPPWMEEMGRDLTALGGVAVLGLTTVVVAVYFLLRRDWAQGIYILVTVGGGIAISSLAKDFFGRPRPDLVPYGSIVHTASFPSGHSMMAAVAYLTLGVLIARLQPRLMLKVYTLSVAVLLTVLVGISRVYMGVHWPTDVLAGWLAGGAWAMVCVMAARWLVHPGRAARDG